MLSVNSARVTTLIVLPVDLQCHEIRVLIFFLVRPGRTRYSICCYKFSAATICIGGTYSAATSADTNPTTEFRILRTNSTEQSATCIVRQQPLMAAENLSVWTVMNAVRRCCCDNSAILAPSANIPTYLLTYLLTRESRS